MNDTEKVAFLQQDSPECRAWDERLQGLIRAGAERQKRYGAISTDEIAGLLASLDVEPVVEPEPVPLAPVFRLKPAKIDTIVLKVRLRRSGKLATLLRECRASLALPDDSGGVGLDSGDPGAIHAGAGCRDWWVRVEDPSLSKLRALVAALDQHYGVDVFEIDRIDIAVDAVVRGGEAEQRAYRLFIRNRLSPRGFGSTWRAVASRYGDRESGVDWAAWNDAQERKMAVVKSGGVVFDQMPSGTSYLSARGGGDFAEFSIYHKILDQRRALLECDVSERCELSLSKDALRASGHCLRDLDDLERFDFSDLAHFFRFRQTDMSAVVPVVTQSQLERDAPVVVMSSLNKRFRDALGKLKLG